MDNKIVLKASRDVTLKLHKSLIDREKELIERSQGPITPGQFLEMLLEDESFAWLKVFSNFIVVTDEMFAQKGGYSEYEVNAIISNFNDLIEFKALSDIDAEKIKTAMQDDGNIAALMAELKATLKEAS